MAINLNNRSFDDWLIFAFDHPISTPSTAWYWDDEWDWEAEPEHILKYSIKLFTNPQVLLEKFSYEQINQGFWFLLGATNQLSDWIWDKEIEWTLREKSIKSMEGVFTDLFSANPIQDACFMWWDLLRDFSDEPDQKVINTMFETLSKILKLESLDCQESALHGLGHLEHTSKKSVIENFLRKYSNLDEDFRKYALAAIEGKIL
jgi:hypothetical protein